MENSIIPNSYQIDHNNSSNNNLNSNNNNNNNLRALGPNGNEIINYEPQETKAITEIEITEFKEQDRFLPLENISRIMKKSLPPNTKVSKDAKETVQECTSEFISFITSEAADKCISENRKTITGEDILWAASTLGFENYAQALRIYLTKYREHQLATGKRTSKKAKQESIEQAIVVNGKNVEEEEEEEESEEDDSDDDEEEGMSEEE